MLKLFLSALFSGILVAIGGCVYLSSLGSAQLYVDAAVGALLLGVAFILIAAKGYALFTEKASSLADGPAADTATALLTVLLGNLVGSLLVGSLVALTMGDGLSQVAYYAVLSELADPWYLTLLLAFFGGLLLELAFSVYREKGSFLAVLLAAPALIMGELGYAVLFAFYFAASGFYGGLRSVGLLLLVILGNALGAALFPLLSRLVKDAPAADVSEDEDGEEYEPCFTDEEGDADDLSDEEDGAEPEVEE